MAADKSGAHEAWVKGRTSRELTVKERERIDIAAGRFCPFADSQTHASEDDPNDAQHDHQNAQPPQETHALGFWLRACI